MFTNLIESNSHAADLTRRGSFVLGTLAAYAVLLVLGGIMSIYAYDAHLDNQTLELTTLIAQPILPQITTSQPAAPNQTSNPAASDSSVKQVSTITRDFIPATENSTAIPDQISSAPSNNQVLPAGLVRIGDKVDIASGGSVPGNSKNRGGGSNSTGQNLVAVEGAIPPPMEKSKPAAPTRPTKPISLGVITSKMIDKPSLAYPPMAKTAGAHGPVTVQIVVDEFGKVISARAVSGHPLLYAAATQAAFQARFTPTLLSHQPVKVSGVITFNFMLH